MIDNILCTSLGKNQQLFEKLAIIVSVHYKYFPEMFVSTELKESARIAKDCVDLLFTHGRSV